MKERPILFSGEMVRAILDGRKTQTRLIVKHKNDWYMEDGMPWPEFESYVYAEDGIKVPCPYGRPGDRLWVKETIDAEMYASRTWNGLTYRADGGEVIADHPPGWNPPLKTIKTHRESGDNIPGGGFDWYTGTVPSIFMPRWASRITLEITGIRVERLQDISENGARAEGFGPSGSCCNGSMCGCAGLPIEPAKVGFMGTWKSLYGQGSWSANPWVWVVEFKRSL